MNPPHAVIAGAGIGGLSTALSLARVGWRVSLYEKAKVLEESGAGLQLSPNASAILRNLGVLEHLTPFALCPEAIRIRRARDGATLALMPLESAEKRWGRPILSFIAPICSGRFWKRSRAKAASHFRPEPPSRALPPAAMASRWRSRKARSG